MSAAEAGELDQALDLLVGDETRRLLARAESSESAELAERMRTEARTLAPVDRLSFDQLRAAAADRRHQERLAAVLGP